MAVVFDLTYPLVDCASCAHEHAEIWKFFSKRSKLFQTRFPAVATLNPVKPDWTAHECPQCKNLLLLSANFAPPGASNPTRVVYKFLAASDRSLVERWNQPIAAPAGAILTFLQTERPTLRSPFEESDTLPCAVTLKTGEVFEKALIFMPRVLPIANKKHTRAEPLEFVAAFKSAVFLDEVASVRQSPFALSSLIYGNIGAMWRPYEDRVSSGALYLVDHARTKSFVIEGSMRDFVDEHGTDGNGGPVRGRDLEPVSYQDPILSQLPCLPFNQPEYDGVVLVVAG